MQLKPILNKNKMYKQTLQQRTSVRFKRFCRARWAAYSSMHREVTIGRLTARVADSSLRKGVAAAVVAFALSQGPATAQSTDDGREARILPEVQIMSGTDTLASESEPAAVITAEEIKQRNIHSIAELAAQLPGVDVRVRGVGDAQADFSMRGGTFDQMLVLLNGINLTDAQTGHHNLDLPIDISMVQRVELLSPAQLMARGIVALCGAVNLVVDETYADRLMVELGVGSHGTANASLLASHSIGKWSMTAAGSLHCSDGYMPNTDYRHGNLYLQAMRHSDRDDLRLQVGGQAKAFGSQAFYSTTYPDQFEATRTLVASVTDLHRFGRVRLETALFGRLHADRFELFRDGVVEAPDWYTGHNHHLGSLAGMQGRVLWPLGVGEALAGAGWRREGIRSNVLGLPDTTLAAPYTKHDARSSAVAFAGWRYANRRWRVQTVALGLYSTRFGCDYGFSADAEFRAADRLTLHGSMGRSYRQPTFTDLYYQSRNQQADPGLTSEHCFNAEVGALFVPRPLDINVTAYYRAGRDVIDWVRRPDEEMWYSMNHSVVDVVGVDAAFSLTMSKARLSLGYSFCHVAQDAGQWVSGAVLDYLRHRAEVRGSWHPTSWLTLRGGVACRQREGEWVDADGHAHRYGTAILADAAVESRLRNVTLYAEGHNLLGTRYRDHGGVPMPGRTFMRGLRLKV